MKTKLVKHPKDMSTEELIELADKIKSGITRKFLEDARKLKRARKTWG